MDLQGKSAIVTGGGSGLGAAAAALLAERGARVVVVDVNDDGGNRVAEEIGGHFAVADITDPDAVRRAVDFATSVAPLWAVVSCAGGGTVGRTIGRDGEFDSAHDLEAFRRVVELNVVGTFNVTRMAATAMARNEPDENGQRGAIVNTASVAAFDGQVGQAAYSAGKAGIVGMTLPIARDLSRAGIRINAIAPGTFATPPMLGAPEAVKAKLAESTLSPKRFGDPREFASLAFELLTNPYVNAETVRLDGGIRMGF
jgi:NAD(P)-dependent dehydrogenase (short-subunit alcohol dehydrogenase family)